MTYSKLQNLWYSKEKFILNSQIKFFLLNSTNVPLLLSTILVVDAKIGKRNQAGLQTGIRREGAMEYK